MAFFNKATAVAEPEAPAAMDGALFDELVDHISRILENSSQRTSAATRAAGGDWVFAGRASACAYWLTVAYEAGLSPDQDRICRDLERRCLHLIVNTGSTLGAGGLTVIETLSFPRNPLSPELNTWCLTEHRKRMPIADDAGAVERATRLREAIQIESLLVQLREEKARVDGLPNRIQTLEARAKELRQPLESKPLPWEA